MISGTLASAFETNAKFAFYEGYGVEEYYTYDPFSGALRGWLRRDGRLTENEFLPDWGRRDLCGDLSRALGVRAAIIRFSEQQADVGVGFHIGSVFS